MTSKDTLRDVAAKLTKLQADLDDMSARRANPDYMLGWLRGGITDALDTIEGAL